MVKSWWFNPRDGTATAIDTFANTGEREFTPPDAGEMLDWVLVLDDAAQSFPPPGRDGKISRHFVSEHIKLRLVVAGGKMGCAPDPCRRIRTSWRTST